MFLTIVGEIKILHHIFPADSAVLLNTTWDYKLQAKNSVGPITSNVPIRRLSLSSPSVKHLRTSRSVERMESVHVQDSRIETKPEKKEEKIPDGCGCTIV
jgi:hypothetical protein